MFKANKFLAIIVLFFFVVIMGSCGGGGGGGSSSGGGNTPPANDTTTYVVGQNGGFVGSSDNKFNAEIPPAALPSETLINVSVINDNHGQVGPIYQVSAQASEDLAFSKPVTIKINFDPYFLPEGANEKDLILAISGPFESWKRLTDTIVDTVNHLISATTSHFSSVAVFPKTSNAIPPKLSFPLPYRSPFDVAITAVFDHSMSEPYKPDSIVKAYTGEIGDFNKIGCDEDLLCEYSNSSMKEFLVGYVNYVGAVGGKTYLSYDGHPGYDFRTKDQDQNGQIGQINVFAAAGGKVTVPNEGICWNGDFARNGVKDCYGSVLIDHGGYITKYLHLSKKFVTNGNAVQKGVTIGISGNTSPKPIPLHLHFEVRKNGNEPIDPYAKNLWETDVIPPTTPTGPPGALTLTVTLECSGEGTPQIRLTWTSSIGVDYYNIYKNGSLYEGVSSNVTTFVDTAVTTGITYSYFIRAINSGGPTDSNPVTLTATCQGIRPGIFTLTAIPWCNGSNPIIHLEWGGSAGRTLPYELYRYGTLVFTTDFNNYDDTVVTAGTTYNYFVRAKNSVGYRDSNTVTVTSKSDCGAPVSPVINTISPQSVTVGNGGFTLTITGQYFDSTAKILWAFSGQTPATVVYPTFVDSSTLTVQVTQNSGGFSPFLYPGALVIQVIKPGPNFWDGQRSNIMSFTIFNPVPIVNSISGTCRANLNCTPGNGFDVKISGSGFVNNLVNSSISSSYAEINGSSTPVSLIGQGPVTSQMQLYVNGSLIPTPGTYTVNVCNAGTIQGTACSTGSLTVTP